MISSQLSAQLFPSQATWDLLCDRYSGEIWRRTAPPELRVETWWRVIHVYLPKSEDRRGVSLLLSFWDYIDWFMMRSQLKADLVQVFQMRQRIFTATSSQGSEGELHTVHFTLWGASCTCMLYKCLRNRISKELPYYWELMKESRFFAGQVVCHHIEAALNTMGCSTLSDYLEGVSRARARGS